MERRENETDGEFAERLRQEIAREERWAQNPTEWPHHRAQYARAAAEMRQQLAALTT